MLDFLNEVLLIEDLEPDAYQMGISGKSGAKMKAPDGGKASIKGDFNALHPRYPKGHPKGGKFMPKGSKDQIQAIAKNTGQSVEKVAAAVGGKAPANKGKLKKFSGSAGAVGKAQKVLKNKESTPEQRAKAKASIAKAADKMRFSKMSTGELFKESDRIMNKPIYKEGGKAGGDAEKSKRGKISNKELMARNMGESSAPKGVSKKVVQQRAKRRKELVGKALGKASGKKIVQNVITSEIARNPEYNKVQYMGNDKAIAKSIARNKAKTDPSAKAARKAAAKSEAPMRKAKAKGMKNAKIVRKVEEKANAGSASAKKALEKFNNIGKSVGTDKKAVDKSIARNKRKKSERVAKEVSRMMNSDQVVNDILSGRSTTKKDKKKFGLTKMSKQDILGQKRESAGLGFDATKTVKGLSSYLQGEAGSTGKTRSKLIGKLFQSEMARQSKPTQDDREKMAAKASYKRSQKGKGGLFKPAKVDKTPAPKLSPKEMVKLTGKAKAKGVAKKGIGIGKLKQSIQDRRNAAMFDFGL